MDYNYNIEPFQNDFIDNFMKTFPGMYNREDLEIILKQNVLDLDCNLDSDCNLGAYSPFKRKIELVQENPHVLFHEFIHGLRTNSLWMYNPELSGIEEAFTEYATCVYSICSKDGFKQSYPKRKFVTISNKEYKIKHILSYDTLVFIIEQLEFVNSFVDSDETLLETFLQRKNIYEKIKNIYMKYYQLTGVFNPEDEAEKDTIAFILKLNSIVVKMQEEATCIDMSQGEYKLDPTTKKEVAFIVQSLEDEMLDMLYVLSDGKYNQKLYNELAIINYSYNFMETLDLNIVGQQPKDVVLVKKLLNI